MDVGKLEFAVDEKWRKALANNSWVAFVPEFAFDQGGQKFVRNKRSDSGVIYRIIKADDDRNRYICNGCEGDVIVAEVAHTVRDGLFPLSGSGEVKYEKVPYCPNCEDEPNYHGDPIPAK